MTTDPAHLQRAMELTRKMVAMRDQLREIYGEEWRKKLEPWTKELDRQFSLAPDKTRVGVAQALCVRLEGAGHGHAVRWVIAALVESSEDIKPKG